MTNQEILNNIFTSAISPMTDDLKSLCSESISHLTKKETIADIFPAMSHKVITIDNKQYPVSLTIEVLKR